MQVGGFSCFVGTTEGLRHVRIGLVACTKRKQPYTCTAREMYRPSALFRKAAAHCAREYDKWYVLSAKYGLISPHDIIEPYDKTLKTMSLAERKAWGQTVSAQLRRLGNHEYLAHAGRNYVEPLSGVNVINVLSGLRIGERLRWYDSQLVGGGAMSSRGSPTHGAPQRDSELPFSRLLAAARWYGQHTDYDQSYASLLRKGPFLSRLRVNPSGLTVEDVLDELIIGFLNSWGCRLPNTSQAALAIRSSLVRAADTVIASADNTLLDVDLSNRPTAKGHLIAGAYEVMLTAHRVGPTTASKILHVLNPALFVMWDMAIRRHYSSVCDSRMASGVDYVVFLRYMQELALSVTEDFASQHGLSESIESYVPRYLGHDRPVTLAKLLDEYNWATIVRRARMP